MMDERHSLPIADSREEILTAINTNQVVLIRGETGSGKTTQVCLFDVSFWNCLSVFYSAFLVIISCLSVFSGCAMVFGNMIIRILDSKLLCIPSDSANTDKTFVKACHLKDSQWNFILYRSESLRFLIQNWSSL